MKLNKIGLSLLLAVSVFAASCGAPSIVLKQNYDFTKIKKVAVLGFNDAAYYPNSGAMVSELFIKYLLGSGYNVIERTQLDAILKEYQLSSQGITDPAEAKRLGKIAGVDALVIGSIPYVVPERSFYDNGEMRYVAAQVGVTFRMISVETGEVIAAGSNTYDAMDVQTAFEYLVSSLVDELIRDLRKK
jgi:curli biogenesis system outer membrane secretion channel CsgG